MEEYLLKLEDVSKGHHGVPVLRHVNLCIEAGRMIGLAGDNGLGKTTLLRLMTGMWRPDGGSIWRSAGRMTCVPSAEEFETWMRVREAVWFYQTYYDNFSAEKAGALLEESGLSGNTRIRQLSKGQQERLFLILTICQDAQLYLMDEPLNGIDPYFKQNIRQFLLKNLPENATVIMATHLLRELEQLFDEMIFVTEFGVSQMDSDEIRQKYGKSIEQYYLEVIRRGKK